MRRFSSHYLAVCGLIATLLLSCCATPTLEDIARQRVRATDKSQANLADAAVEAYVTDADVINYTNVMIKSVESRGHIHEGAGYGVSTTQTTLGALAGAAQTIGWGAATASGLGMGATYVFSIGQLFDPKDHAVAYEQAYTALVAAKNNYYFRRLGGGFDSNGKAVFPDGASLTGVPSAEEYTPDGQTLSYRVGKIMKVLNDTLASKIPDLTDLKEANGEQPPGAPMIDQNSLPQLKQPVNPVHGHPTPPPPPSLAVMQARGDVVTSLSKIPAATRNVSGFYSDLIPASVIKANGTNPPTKRDFRNYLNTLNDLPTLASLKAQIDAKAAALAATPSPTPAPTRPVLLGAVTPAPGQTPPPTPKP